MSLLLLLLALPKDLADAGDGDDADSPAAQVPRDDDNDDAVSHPDEAPSAALPLPQLSSGPLRHHNPGTIVPIWVSAALVGMPRLTLPSRPLVSLYMYVIIVQLNMAVLFLVAKPHLLPRLRHICVNGFFGSNARPLFLTHVLCWFLCVR